MGGERRKDLNVVILMKEAIHILRVITNHVIFVFVVPNNQLGMT